MFYQHAFDPGDHSRQRVAQTPVIAVPTSTAILYNIEDPYLILVGLSHKHTKPVLPGGKIEVSDLNGTNLAEAARSCIIREIREETGVEVRTIELFATISHGSTDERSVPASVLRDTIVYSEVSEVPGGALVKARYGNPDYVFLGPVTLPEVAPSAELYQLGFIDIRCVSSDALGAGHSEIIERYRMYLEEGEAVAQE